MNNSIAVGSLLHEVQSGNQKSVAEAFTNVKVIILVDVSASMSANDAAHMATRIQVAREITERLQARFRGQVLLASFSAGARFHYDGRLPEPMADTPMLDGLKLVKPLCVGDIQVYLISDGEPTDESESEIIQYASKYFKNRLHTAYAGPEGSAGAKFMAALAAACNGQSSADALLKPLKLEERITLLLK